MMARIVGCGAERQAGMRRPEFRRNTFGLFIVFVLFSPIFFLTR